MGVEMKIESPPILGNTQELIKGTKWLQKVKLLLDQIQSLTNSSSGVSSYASQQITKLSNDKADKTYVDSEINNHETEFHSTLSGVDGRIMVLLSGISTPSNHLVDDVVFRSEVLSSGAYPINSDGKLKNGPTPLSGEKIYYVSDSIYGSPTRKLTFLNGILISEI